MPRKDHGPSVKDPEPYERLREQGESKEKAARIANEAARGGAPRSASVAASLRATRTGPSRSFGSERPRSASKAAPR